MNKLNKNKIGLILGILLGGFHLIWSLLVALIPKQLQIFFNWIFTLHSIRPVWIITQFNLVNAIILVVLTFAIGYIIGWAYAYFHNIFHKK